MIGHLVRGGELITCNAVVTAALAAGFFRVEIDDCWLATRRRSGKMQRSHIAIAAGDAVICEFAAGCFSKGRIIHRFTGEGPVIRPRHRRRAREGRVRAAS
jgi:translation initiation factor IF-1